MNGGIWQRTSRRLARIAGPLSLTVGLAGMAYGRWGATNPDMRVAAYLLGSIGFVGAALNCCAGYFLRLVRTWRESIREQEQFFTMSLDLLCIAGTDGYLKRVNPAFSRTLGYSDEELLSRPFLDFVHPDDIETTRAEVESLGKGKPSLHFENRYRCKDGSWKWLAWNTQPFNENGQVYAVARDVTERKSAELAIHQLNSELLQRTSKLGELNTELESFSYSVSHDLRAPLRGISGFAQALEDHTGGSLDPTGAAYLQRVKNAAERMGLLIDDLLDLSRLSRAEMHVKPVNFSEMAESAVAALKSRDPDRKVEVGIMPDVWLWADPALLEVLLDNLIGNAWKFTSRNPDARIAIGRRPRDSGQVRYFVEDNGVGFDERYAHKLFGAFQRLHNQMEFPGTGIGLATVQRIVRRHGGEVFAKSVINHGATFEFTLSARVEGGPHEEQDHSADRGQPGRRGADADGAGEKQHPQ